MKKTYFQLLFLPIFVFLSSCRTTHEAIMGDVIRFSDDVTTTYDYKDGKFKNLSFQSEPIKLYGEKGVNKGEVSKMKNFIHKDHRANATSGYYALDLGIDRVKYVRKHQFKHDPNTKYYIVYMTDGLDNASVQLAKNKKQIWFINSEERYVKHIQKKIKNAMGIFKSKQNTFQIFPMMFIGQDMLDNFSKRGLQTKEERIKAANDYMQSYRGASKGTLTPEVILGEDFKDITRGFEEMFKSAGYEFYIPKGYNKRKVRMTLVNDKKEEIQIEGVLKKKWFKWCFTDITYPSNVTIPDKRVINAGDKLKELYAYNDNKDLHAKFRIDEIKLDGKNYVVKNATQEHEHSGFYETNTEYDANQLANTNAYVLLIMDESTSLGNKTKDEQKAMEDILNIIIKAIAK